MKRLESLVKSAKKIGKSAVLALGFMASLACQNPVYTPPTSYTPSARKNVFVFLSPSEDRFGSLIIIQTNLNLSYNLASRYEIEAKLNSTLYDKESSDPNTKLQFSWKDQALTYADANITSFRGTPDLLLTRLKEYDEKKYGKIDYYLIESDGNESLIKSILHLDDLSNCSDEERECFQGKFAEDAVGILLACETYKTHEASFAQAFSDLTHTTLYCSETIVYWTLMKRTNEQNQVTAFYYTYEGDFERIKPK